MTIVLLIEQDAKERDFLKRCFEKSGLKSLLAKTYKDGIKIAERKIPNVIIINEESKNSEAIEAIKYLKTCPQAHHIPMIGLIKRWSEGRNIEEFLSLVDEAEFKPIVPERLLEKISMLLLYR